VEISRPGARPLSSAQQQALERTRGELHRRALNGGLSGDDIKRIVAVIKAQPEVSYAVILLLAEEAETLRGAGPGLGLLDLGG